MVRSSKDAAITIRLSEEDRDALQEVADAEDVSVGHIVRRAVREFLDRRAKKPKATK